MRSWPLKELTMKLELLRQTLIEVIEKEGGVWDHRADNAVSELFQATIEKAATNN
jgi:hypothetical protein